MNAAAGLFWWLHCSRLSLYPRADAGKAGSTYSAYSNDIRKRKILQSRGGGGGA